MKKYLIVVEPTETGYSAYSPDLPGCIATGQTRAEVESNMHEAIAFHLDGLREEGHPCASLSLHLHLVVKRTCISQPSNMLGTIGIGGAVTCSPPPHHPTCGSASGGSVS